MENSSQGLQPTKDKNPDHFNIHGDKTVEVEVRLVFDVNENVDTDTVLRNAVLYLQGKLNRNEHSSWGRSIEVRSL